MLVSNNDDLSHTTFSPRESFVVPAAPEAAPRFLRAKGFQASTRAATIANLVDWTKRLEHMYGPRQAAGFRRIRQYRGPAPVTATVNSRLRILDIPVENNEQYGHSLTRFMADSLYLSHADDPYRAEYLFLRLSKVRSVRRPSQESGPTAVVDRGRPRKHTPRRPGSMLRPIGVRHARPSVGARARPWGNVDASAATRRHEDLTN